LLNLPLFCVWQICFFAVLWLHGGMPVALMFGGAMSTVALVAVGFCHAAQKRKRSSDVTV
jgi:hypothetical protein